MLNYLAAPFGSEEHLLLNYGVKDVEFKFDAAGNPALTQQGAQDLTVPWRFLVAGPDVWYHATSVEYAEVGHKLQSDLRPIGIDDPTIGLYSRTSGQKGAGLDRKFNEAAAAILFGQADVSTSPRPLSSGDGTAVTRFERSTSRHFRRQHADVPDRWSDRFNDIRIG